MRKARQNQLTVAEGKTITEKIPKELDRSKETEKKATVHTSTCITNGTRGLYVAV
jgi:hypothetical protein